MSNFIVTAFQIAGVITLAGLVIGGGLALYAWWSERRG